jgi:hypothetical protein
MKYIQPFDERVGNVERFTLKTPTQAMSSELARILYQIRTTSDRVGGESWEQFYDRTYSLALAEYARRLRQRRQTRTGQTRTHTD